MKLFISLGLFLTLWCRLSKAQTINITTFASQMWNLDGNRVDSDWFTLDLQVEKETEKNYEDEALRSLFKYFDENEIYKPEGTYDTFLPLCDNYERVRGTNEDYTMKEENEISAYLDDIMETDLMIEAFNQFQNDGYVTDLDDFRGQLRTAFFDFHEHEHHESHIHNVYDSCGFELTFCGELEGPGGVVHGLFNWITFYEQEKPGGGDLNYHGYMEYDSVLDSAQLLEVQFSWSGGLAESSPMFVGVSTEFELAIYMACFFRGGDCVFTLNNVDVDVHVETSHDFQSHIGEAYMHHYDPDHH